MADSHDFGKKAENFAAEYLVAKGYLILHRNWHYDHKELDIICTDNTWLVIVEVKARYTSIFPYPGDILSRNKERMIIEATEGYLQKYPSGKAVRFDLIAVIFNREGFSIEHIEDAFLPGVE